MLSLVSFQVDNFQHWVRTRGTKFYLDCNFWKVVQSSHKVYKCFTICCASNDYVYAHQFFEEISSHTEYTCGVYKFAVHWMVVSMTTGMIVFIQKLSELGSDRSQDSAVSPWRLSIFLSQSNISKPVGPRAGAGVHRADAKYMFLRGEMNFSCMLIKRFNR